MGRNVIVRNSCLICGSGKIADDFQIGHRKIGHCRQCGFSFAVEYSPDNLEKCYAEDYYPSDNPEVSLNWIRQNFPVWKQLCCDFPEGRIESLLDIGAGTGGFLQAFHEKHPETSISGSEPSASARAFLKQYQPYGSFLASPEEFSGQFQVITLLQVLEHVEDPFSMCRMIRSKLKDGGSFLLTVPNRNSYEVMLYEKANSHCYGNCTHLQFFRQRDLVMLLGKSGFSRIRRIASFGSGGSTHCGKQILQYLMRRAGISTELRFICEK